MSEFKYFVLDAGEGVKQYAELLIEQLRKDGNSVVYYDTDLPYLLQLEQVDEDTFLDHYKTYLQINN